MEERRKNKLCFGCNKKWSKEHKFQETKLFGLENNDEEEVETSTQKNEEEFFNLKEQKIEDEIVHNIDSNRCEIYVHALVLRGKYLYG
jgi:hypothetical protein